MKKINWTFMAIVLGMFCVFNLSCTKSEEPQPCSPKTGSEEPEKSSVQNKEISMATQKIKLQTTMGDIVIELDEEKAPVTVKNFLGYVERGFYEGTIFHRVMSGFMIQGGGLTEDMQKKSTEAAIINEASNGLKNDRGTIAMARTGHPDSATAQFFISVIDNDFLNYTGPGNPGYAVFGKVVEGMDIVDKIAAVKTTTRGSADVPVKPVIINSCSLIED